MRKVVLVGITFAVIGVTEAAEASPVMGFGKKLRKGSGGRIEKYFMEGKIKQSHSGSKGRDTDNVPGRIHEYDFFLTQDEEEGAGKSDPEAEAEIRSETVEAKKEQNKSIIFFLPD